MNRGGRKLIGHLRRGNRGSVALMFGLMVLPIVLTTGVAVDTSRLIRYRTLLQDAADNAALSGAVLYVTNTPDGAGPTKPDGKASAIAAASNLFNSTIKILMDPSEISLSSGPVITPSQTFLANGKNKENSIKIDATARVKLTILSLFIRDSQDISVSATASNPFVDATITPSKFPMSTSALDQNTVFVYPVAMTNGYRDIETLPDIHTRPDWILMDNCNMGPPDALCRTTADKQAFGRDWTPASPSPTFHISSTTFIGFMLKNVTGYLSPSGYGSNAHGAPFGAVNLFMTANRQRNAPPSYGFLDRLHARPDLFGFDASAGTAAPTTYDRVMNCSVQAKFTENDEKAPLAKQCFDINDTISGYGATWITCSQVANKTLRHFWNDMGGNPEDLDYNDAVYSMRCTQAEQGSPILVLLTD